jgi:hypothetical protein
MTTSTAEDFLLKGHVRKIVEAILAGRLVPFLGADINLCDRPKRADGHDEAWTPEASFPPSNHELAAYLNANSAGLGPAYQQQLRCPFSESRELEHLPEECPLRTGGALAHLPVQNVSQNLNAIGDQGSQYLYEALSRLFEQEYTPNSIHRFFAALPGLLRSRSKSPTYPLIVTACFDSALERAFAEANEEIDLVSFIGDAQNGHFQHHSPEADGWIDIDEPNKNLSLDLSKRPVVLKLYGGYESQSFLITEDDYIDYLSHSRMTELIPSSLLPVLHSDATTVWFLGYGLSLWNQRVILRRLWQGMLVRGNKPWWAIQANPEPLDLQLWHRYIVQTLQHPPAHLEEYVANVQARLEDVPTLPSVTTPGTSSKPTARRDKVFFSYSHEDEKWLQELKAVLTPAIRAGLLSEWDDTQIQPGARWRDEIETALAAAKVAVLLVSKAFLNSEFITSEELPTLLKAEKDKGVIIVPVVLDHCLYDLSGLKDFQAANDVNKPLSGLSAAKCDETLARIARKILDVLPKESD